MEDARLSRFVRGELSADEIAVLEVDLDRDPTLQRALLDHARTMSRVDGPAAPEAVSLLDGPSRLMIGPSLGEGGMATVRRGIQTNLGRAVAVKTLREETPEGAELLLQEARLTARLQHPNIVPVHEILRGHGGELQIVLKQIDGVLWGDVMGLPEVLRTRFDVQDPLDFNLGVLVAVCHALAFAHERGVIHRDVRPSNIMIGNFGEIYLLDWGIAGLWGERRDHDVAHVEDSPVAGTPAFMAPEQIEGEAELLGPWTDVYLLGATLYHALGGHAPHSDSQDTSGSLHRRPRERKVPPLPSDVPSALVALVEAAMAPNPEDRLMTPQAFQAELETFRRRRGSLHLAERADESLRRAIAEGARKDLERHLGQAEFGYRAALETWPENEHALVGLERITAQRTLGALDADQLEEAERIYETFQREPPEEVRQRLGLARELRDQRLVYAERTNWNRAVGVGVIARTLILAVYAPFWILGWVGIAIWPPPTNRPLLALLLGYVILGVLVVVVRGVSMLKDHFNRVNLLGAGLALVAALLWTSAAVRLALPVTVTQLGYLLIFPLTFGVVALTSDPRALAPAVVGALAFLVASLAPAYSGVAFAFSAVVMAVSVLINNLRFRQSQGRTVR